MAVEQNSDLLNELADDWLNEEGDAERAWEVIARCIDEERQFPTWVLRYLRRVADNPPLPVEGAERVTKEYYDAMDVFSTVTAWRQKEKLSLQKCFARYINERLNGRGEEETIKTAYYRGLRMAENEIAFMEALSSD
ncbi:MAG: hypothetical protein AAGK02_06645 [Pseudomonadota bacterium]